MPDSRPVPAAPADLTDADIDTGYPRNAVTGWPDPVTDAEIEWIDANTYGCYDGLHRRLLADLRTARRERDALAEYVNRDVHEFVAGPASDPEACWVQERNGSRCCFVRDADRHQTARIVLADMLRAATLTPATVPTTTGDPDAD